MAYKKEKKRNTPIVQLIKQYRDKKSGRVVESREEIKKRFEYLDWKDQKTIILAFLESSKTDRDWAYSRALDYWDKSFQPKIKSLWEQLHEEKCKWVVIHHFPQNYLSENIQDFKDDRDYFFLCMRFADDSRYEIDKSRLSPKDYLAVICHTGRSITSEEATEALYNCVHNVCIDRDNSPGTLEKNADVGGTAFICAESFKDVNLALYYLRQMDFIKERTQFLEWDYKVKLDIFNSPEFQDIYKMGLADYEFLMRKITIAKKYIYQHLDERYKKDSDPDVESFLYPKDWYEIVYDTVEHEEEEIILPF